ncbi:MAG: DinB family protein [Planctomycetota bacterium]|nr:DinB family protein [Planctomycetota bacterium]
MSVTAASVAASSIIQAGQVNLLYGQMLLKDIPAADAARQPKGYNTNHPVWIFGHLALYPDKGMLPLMGRDDLVKPTPNGWAELFGAKSECRDDAKGDIYPSLDTVANHFLTRTEVLYKALAETSDDVLAGPLPPDHFFKDRMNSVGGVITFMACCHTMSHFGQLSAWRRIMGLGPCM